MSNGKVLTLETVMLRMKNDKLHTLLKLNLWGNDLEDVSCLVNIPNLEVVSLAVNKIKTLKAFARLSNLKELYLRGNKISSFAEINFLKNCKQLRTLSLNENPISALSNYRKKMIQMLPCLLKLDDKVISEEERVQAEQGEDEEDLEVSDDANENIMEDEKSLDDRQEQEKPANKKVMQEENKSKDGSKGGGKNFANLNKRLSNLQTSKGKLRFYLISNR